MEKEVIISVRHLKKVFGSGESEQVVYSDFDIDIYKGDFTVIMGASGAGKSTLMYSLSGMDKPNAGTIKFCGTEIGEIFGDCNLGTYSADDKERTKKLEDFLAKMGW